MIIKSIEHAKRFLKEIVRQEFGAEGSRFKMSEMINLVNYLAADVEKEEAIEWLKKEPEAERYVNRLMGTEPALMLIIKNAAAEWNLALIWKAWTEIEDEMNKKYHIEYDVYPPN